MGATCATCGGSGVLESDNNNTHINNSNRKSKITGGEEGGRGVESSPHRPQASRSSMAPPAVNSSNDVNEMSAGGRLSVDAAASMSRHTSSVASIHGSARKDSYYVGQHQPSSSDAVNLLLPGEISRQSSDSLGSADHPTSFVVGSRKNVRRQKANSSYSGAPSSHKMDSSSHSVEEVGSPTTHHASPPLASLFERMPSIPSQVRSRQQSVMAVAVDAPESPASRSASPTRLALSLSPPKGSLGQAAATRGGETSESTNDGKPPTAPNGESPNAFPNFIQATTSTTTPSPNTSGSTSASAAVVRLFQEQGKAHVGNPLERPTLHPTQTPTLRPIDEEGRRHVEESPRTPPVNRDDRKDEKAPAPQLSAQQHALSEKADAFDTSVEREDSSTFRGSLGHGLEITPTRGMSSKMIHRIGTKPFANPVPVFQSVIYTDDVRVRPAAQPKEQPSSSTSAHTQHEFNLNSGSLEEDDLEEHHMFGGALSLERRPISPLRGFKAPHNVPRLTALQMKEISTTRDLFGGSKRDRVKSPTHARRTSTSFSEFRSILEQDKFSNAHELNSNPQLTTASSLDPEADFSNATLPPAPNADVPVCYGGNPNSFSPRVRALARKNRNRPGALVSSDFAFPQILGEDIDVPPLTPSEPSNSRNNPRGVPKEMATFFTSVIDHTNNDPIEDHHSEASRLWAENVKKARENKLMHSVATTEDASDDDDPASPEVTLEDHGSTTPLGRRSRKSVSFNNFEASQNSERGGLGPSSPRPAQVATLLGGSDSDPKIPLVIGRKAGGITMIDNAEIVTASSSPSESRRGSDGGPLYSSRPLSREETVGAPYSRLASAEGQLSSRSAFWMSRSSTDVARVHTSFTGHTNRDDGAGMMEVSSNALLTDREKRVSGVSIDSNSLGISRSSPSHGASLRGLGSDRNHSVTSDISLANISSNMFATSVVVGNRGSVAGSQLRESGTFSPTNNSERVPSSPVHPPGTHWNRGGSPHRGRGFGASPTQRSDSTCSSTSGSRSVSSGSGRGGTFLPCRIGSLRSAQLPAAASSLQRTGSLQSPTGIPAKAPMPPRGSGIRGILSPTTEIPRPDFSPLISSAATFSAETSSGTTNDKSSPINHSTAGYQPLEEKIDDAHDDGDDNASVASSANTDAGGDPEVGAQLLQQAVQDGSPKKVDLISVAAGRGTQSDEYFPEVLDTLRASWNRRNSSVSSSSRLSGSASGSSRRRSTFRQERDLDYNSPALSNVLSTSFNHDRRESNQTTSSETGNSFRMRLEEAGGRRLPSSSMGTPTHATRATRTLSTISEGTAAPSSASTPSSVARLSSNAARSTGFVGGRVGPTSSLATIPSHDSTNNSATTSRTISQCVSSSTAVSHLPR